MKTYTWVNSHKESDKLSINAFDWSFAELNPTFIRWAVSKNIQRVY